MANPIQMVKSFSVTTIAIDIHVFVAKELTLRYIHLCKSWLEHTCTLWRTLLRWLKASLVTTLLIFMCSLQNSLLLDTHSVCKEVYMHSVANSILMLKSLLWVLLLVFMCCIRTYCVSGTLGSQSDLKRGWKYSLQVALGNCCNSGVAPYMHPQYPCVPQQSTLVWRLVLVV